MEIALCYMYTIVPVPYRYSTGSGGSVLVSAVRSSNPSSTCSTRPSTGTVRTGRNPAWNMQDVFAAVANSVSVKTFLAITAIRNLNCRQFDFKTAFLNADIPPGVDYYVEQPHGLEQSHDKERLVWKLRKALYGLRKSPLYWFMTILPMMKDLGFEEFGSDMCLFKHKENGALVVLYVDDLLISAKDDTTIEAIAKALGERYELKEC